MQRQVLSQKLQQNILPQQIQLMKLIQLPVPALEQRIKDELASNPALEEGDEFPDPDSLPEPDTSEPETETSNTDDHSDTDTLSGGLDTESDERGDRSDFLDDMFDDDQAGNYADYDDYTTYATEEQPQYNPAAVENNFHEYLEEQIGMLSWETERELAIARQITGSIDDDGYLRRELFSIADDLLFSQHIDASEDEIESVLQRIQRLDPPGVGARSLQECLLIQLQQQLQNDSLLQVERLLLELAHTIVEKYFDEFSKRHYEKLTEALDISEDILKDIMAEIRRLNPKPASGHTIGKSDTTQYILPDFTILNRDGNLELTLNSRNAPELHVSDHYREMLKSYARSARDNNNKSMREAALFIKQKIDAAKWFIDAIRQRQQTLYTTMFAILQYQYDYLCTDDITRLKPMILQDIANMTGLDVSTISRVVNSKYVQTEYGIKSLKSFFSESMSTESGEDVSAREIKQFLQEVIDQEDKRHPLSDDKLTAMLQEKGYTIARRTVAKYRDQLHVPVARLRRML